MSFLSITVHPIRTQKYESELFFHGSADRASTCTSAAGNASFGIDYVLTVTGSDRANRALSFASATSDASILNNVGHGDTSYIIDTSIIPHFTQNAIVNLQFLWYHSSIISMEAVYD